MSDSIALAIKPIVRYPRVAQVGKTYLMTILRWKMGLNGNMRRKSIRFIVRLIVMHLVLGQLESLFSYYIDLVEIMEKSGF